MIDMKIEFNDDKIVIYYYDKKLNINDINNLNNEIKKLIIKLIKKYHISLGYYKVTIYNNEYYGNILEIKKIYENNYQETIDLKIVVFKDVTMYFEFDDNYFDLANKNIFYKNGKYYININKNINIIDYLEYGRVIYS